MSEILIDEEEMLLIISKLDEQIKSLEVIYNEINDKVKCLDGSSDIWSGNTQQVAYDKYLIISNNYTSTINQIKALRVFLENTLNSYLNSDKTLNDSIENNKEELDIN